MAATAFMKRSTHTFVMPDGRGLVAYRDDEKSVADAQAVFDYEHRLHRIHVRGEYRRAEAARDRAAEDAMRQVFVNLLAEAERQGWCKEFTAMQFAALGIGED